MKLGQFRLLRDQWSEKEHLYIKYRVVWKNFVLFLIIVKRDINKDFVEKMLD